MNKLPSIILSVTIIVPTTCDVQIVTGETQSLKLSAQILNVMTYVVKDGILHIGFHPDYNVKTDEEISADIVISALNFVSITGAGNLVL